MRSNWFLTRPVIVSVWVVIYWLAVTILVAVLTLFAWLPALSSHAAEQSRRVDTPVQLHPSR